MRVKQDAREEDRGTVGSCRGVELGQNMQTRLETGGGEGRAERQGITRWWMKDAVRSCRLAAK